MFGIYVIAIIILVYVALGRKRDCFAPHPAQAKKSATYKKAFLYNTIDRAVYKKTANKFSTYSANLLPADYEEINLFCDIGAQQSNLQDVMYKSWCPAICHTGLSDFRSAENLVIPFWSKGLGTAQQPLIKDMCAKAAPLIANSCAPDVTQDPYYNQLCVTPKCTSTNLAWMDAQNGLAALQKNNVTSKEKNQFITNNFCPLVPKIKATCPASHIQDTYAADPYYALCNRGADCPVIPDLWYAREDPVRTLENTRSSDIGIIQDYCKVGKDMARCGYQFYAADPVYQQWCAQPAGCVDSYLKFLDVRTVTAPDENARIQQMLGSYCPAAAAVLGSCVSDDKKDLVLKDPQYQQFCLNPRCARARQKLFMANKTFDTNVPEAIMLQELQNSLCPALQQVNDTCGAGEVANDPRWTKYCSNSRCLELNLATARAEATFQSVTTRDEDAQWQLATRDLCPAYNATLAGCTDPWLRNRITGNPYYKQFCLNPECAANKHKLFLANKSYAATKQLQTLQTEVCPAMQAIVDNPICDSTAVLTDPNWTSHCADATCIPLTIQMMRAEADFPATKDQDTQWQNAVQELCPAYAAVLSGCADPEVKKHVTDNLYYQQYCLNGSCAKDQDVLFKAQREMSQTQGLSATAQLLMLQKSVCPAMQQIMTEPTCNSAAQNAVTSDPDWTNHCSNSACLQYNIQMQNAEAAFPREADVDAQWQIASTQLCPAYAGVLGSCTNSELHQHVTGNPYYQQFCAAPVCAAAQDKLYLANKKFNYNVSQGMNKSGQLQTLQNDVCPAMQQVMDCDTCTAEVRATVTNDPRWTNYCKNTKCLAAQLKVNDAESRFNSAVTQGLTVDGQWQMGFSNLCPAYADVMAGCDPTSDIYGYVRDSLNYKKYCKYPSCAAQQYKIFQDESAFVSQNMTLAAQFESLKTICPEIQAAMNTCDVVDPLWTNQCANMKCLGPQSILDTAKTTFANAVAQGISASTMYQTATSSLCPAYAAVQSACGVAPTDALYKQYCEYPSSAVQENNLLTAKTAWQSLVSQDAQYQGLISTVCPAMNAIVSSATDPLAAAKVTADPLWTKYCKDGNSCITSRLQLLRAQNDYKAQSTMSEDAKWQFATSRFCPAFQSILSTCGPALTAGVLSDPTYLRYCAAPVCAAATNTLGNVEANFSYENAANPYPQLIGTVCPAMQAVQAACADPHQLDADPLWTNYCSAGTTCLSNKNTMATAEGAVARNAAQNINVTQSVLSTLCPIFSSTLSSCTDDTTQNYIKNNNYWKNYCQYPSCAVNTQTLRNAQSQFGTRLLTRSQQYDMLINTICPAYSVAIASSCAPGVSAALQQEPMYTQYCAGGTDCLKTEYNLYTNETALDDAVQTGRAGMTTPGFYSMLQNQVCPAYANFNSSCPASVTTAQQTGDKWYPYCKYPACTTTKATLNAAISNYNNVVDPYSRAQMLAQVCPIFATVSQTCGPDDVASLNQGVLYDQCRDDPQCPVLQYNTADKLRTLNNLNMPLYNINSDYINAVDAYCGSANQTISRCAHVNYSQDATYQNWCAVPACTTAIFALNSEVQQIGRSMSGLSDSNKQYLAQTYVCPKFQTLQQSCSAAVIADYVKNENQTWFGYFAGQCLK